MMGWPGNPWLHQGEGPHPQKPISFGFVKQPFPDALGPGVDSGASQGPLPKGTSQPGSRWDTASLVSVQLKAPEWLDSGIGLTWIAWMPKVKGMCLDPTGPPWLLPRRAQAKRAQRGRPWTAVLVGVALPVGPTAVFFAGFYFGQYWGWARTSCLASMLWSWVQSLVLHRTGLGVLLSCPSWSQSFCFGLLFIYFVWCWALSWGTLPQSGVPSTFLSFEAGSHQVTQAGLELDMHALCPATGLNPL